MHQSAGSTTQAEQSIPYREAYTVPEIAVLLGGASERWVWTQVDTGELPSFKASGRRLVARADLLAYIDGLRADELKAREAAASK
jgi:hypothetical protein